MSIDALITAREASYRGEGDWRTPAIYNTVDELLCLREAGYLVGPDSRAVAAQKFTAHKDNPNYSHAAPGQATARYWTAEEIESIRRCYWRDEHVGRIRQAFPVETAVLDREKRNLQAFHDPELLDAWDAPGDIGGNQARGEHR